MASGEYTMSNNSLLIHITNKKPVPLTDLTVSLLSVSKQYKRFCSRHDLPYEYKEDELYIKEIKPGSIWLALAPYIPIILPIVENFDFILTFHEYLHGIYKYFIGETDEIKYDMSKTEIEEYHNSLLITANDSHDSKIEFIAQKGSTQVNNFIITNTDANAAQNRAKGLIEKKTENVQVCSKVLMRWKQAKFHSDTDTGNRAVIDSICPGSPMKIIFQDDSEKEEMMKANPRFPDTPWHDLVYIVDVEAHKIGNRFKLYKILRYYPKDTFDPEEG